MVVPPDIPTSNTIQRKLTFGDFSIDEVEELLSKDEEVHIPEEEVAEFARQLELDKAKPMEIDEPPEEGELIAVPTHMVKIQLLEDDQPEETYEEEPAWAYIQSDVQPRVELPA